MAGIFDFSLYKYESMADALKRQTFNILNKDEKLTKAYLKSGVEAKQLILNRLEYD